jgi:hypothetical protein
MSIFKFYVHDRSYNLWEIFDTINFNKIELNLNPIENKLLCNDIFTMDGENKINIVHSSVRSGPAIPGVLILNGNKTYGRQSKSGGKGRLLYKCIPDDMRLPAFLVPYEIKNIGFSKDFKNLYVTFTFNEWTDKHPIATLDNVIGPIDVLDNFYEYQLFCKSLNASIQKFQKDTTKALEGKQCNFNMIENIKAKHPSIEDRTDTKKWYIITIDPPKSQDFDDGFSIIDLDNGIQQLSIYISNVTIWMDELNLWDSFSRRISTIYLPDKRRPMLPTILSDCLCSLQQNISRVAFVMDIFIRKDEIIDIKYSNCIVKVSKNYCYEEANLLGDKKYHAILDVVNKLSFKNAYITNVKNSHEMVSYLMIMMNYHCAKELIKHKTGIFRSTLINKEYEVPSSVPDDVSNFIKIWNSTTSQYINGAMIADTRHELLDMDAYIHITSPIRRLVDLLNIIKFQQINGNMIQLSEGADKFYNKWLGDIEYINTTMRSIRKVQCECSLLDLCYNNPETMESEYQGYIFDKIIRNDGLYQYIAFLPKLKLSSRIILREDLDNFECKKFKLFIFNNEEKFKRKIRLQMMPGFENAVHDL